MFDSGQNDGFSKNLSAEQIRYVEQNVLTKPKKDWSAEDLELFNDWFYECGAYYAGVKSLLRDSYLIFKDKKPLILVKKVEIHDAEDIVQEWIMKFQTDTQFDPDIASFETYYKRGIKLLALTKQRKDQKFNYVDLDSEDENGLTGMERLEASEELRDMSIFDNINEMEIKDILDKILNQIDMTDKRIQAVLYRIVGLSYSQVAEKLEVTENYARLLVRRGRILLTELIAKILNGRNTDDSRSAEV